MLPSARATALTVLGFAYSRATATELAQQFAPVPGIALPSARDLARQAVSRPLLGARHLREEIQRLPELPVRGAEGGAASPCYKPDGNPPGPGATGMPHVGPARGRHAPRRALARKLLRPNTAGCTVVQLIRSRTNVRCRPERERVENGSDESDHPTCVDSWRSSARLKRRHQSERPPCPSDRFHAAPSSARPPPALPASRSRSRSRRTAIRGSSDATIGCG
jgi:hypothetical protein